MALNISLQKSLHVYISIATSGIILKKLKSEKTVYTVEKYMNGQFFFFKEK